MANSEETSMSDEELLEKIRGGDPEAFAELYNRYFPSLVRYASTILPNMAANRSLGTS
jgi:hypothetical protein